MVSEWNIFRLRRVLDTLHCTLCLCENNRDVDSSFVLTFSRTGALCTISLCPAYHISMTLPAASSLQPLANHQQQSPLPPHPQVCVCSDEPLQGRGVVGAVREAIRQDWDGVLRGERGGDASWVFETRLDGAGSGAALCFRSTFVMHVLGEKQGGVAKIL